MQTTRGAKRSQVKIARLQLRLRRCCSLSRGGGVFPSAFMRPAELRRHLAPGTRLTERGLAGKLYLFLSCDTLLHIMWNVCFSAAPVDSIISYAHNIEHDKCANKTWPARATMLDVCGGAKSSATLLEKLTLFKLWRDCLSMWAAAASAKVYGWVPGASSHSRRAFAQASESWACDLIGASVASLPPLARLGGRLRHIDGPKGRSAAMRDCSLYGRGARPCLWLWRLVVGHRWLWGALGMRSKACGRRVRSGEALGPTPVLQDRRVVGWRRCRGGDLFTARQLFLPEWLLGVCGRWCGMACGTPTTGLLDAGRWHLTVDRMPISGLEHHLLQHLYMPLTRDHVDGLQHLCGPKAAGPATPQSGQERRACSTCFQFGLRQARPTRSWLSV